MSTSIAWTREQSQLPKCVPGIQTHFRLWIMFENFCFPSRPVWFMYVSAYSGRSYSQWITKFNGRIIREYMCVLSTCYKVKVKVTLRPTTSRSVSPGFKAHEGLTTWYLLLLTFTSIVLSITGAPSDERSGLVKSSANIVWRVCCRQYGMCWQPLLWQRINTQQ
jgi:hypothetical protein